MQVRAAEWRAADGSGWAMVAPEQWSANTVAVSHASQAKIDTPADLESALPDAHALVGDGNDQLTIVFGNVWVSNQVEEMAQWLEAIFPQLENPHEVAEGLREWDCDEYVMAGFPERSWRLFRLRAAIPLAEECRAINEWTFGNVIALGRALLVLWYGEDEEHLTTSSQIDARARRGLYTGEPPSQPIADLASSYCVEAVQAVGEAAGVAAKTVETWETSLYDAAEKPSSRGASPASIAELGALKHWAVGLRGNLDEMAGQINVGQFRSRWSTEGLEPVAESVDLEIAAAGKTVARFRSDVADAFDAANTVAIARQLASSQEQQERADRFEGTVTRLTAFLLVPTLVAAVFGANVQLPGSGWVRTAFMLLAMVAGAVATFLVLRRLGRAT